MFTGIIETLGEIESIREEGTNLHFVVQSELSNELKIDQSVSHNGVCLTVVARNNNSYTVTAIDETIKKTNLGEWQEGDPVNLERAMKLGDRLDGHIVEGHVDQTGTCINIQETNGSWLYTFECDDKLNNLTIVEIDGLSLPFGDKI